MKMQLKMGMRTQTCNEAFCGFLFCIKNVYLFLNVRCLDIGMYACEDGTKKMEANVVFPDRSSEQVSYKQDLHCVQKCYSCIDFQSQIKEVLLELSSSQFIIKPLCKELNYVAAKHAPASGAIWENRGHEDLAVPITGSEVTSKCSYNTHKSRNSEVLRTLQVVPITNQYSALASLPESMTGKHKAVPLESEKSTQHSINYYKRKKDQRTTANPKMNHQARIPAQRPPSPIYHDPGRESVRNYKSDLQTNHIPTLVNDHVSPAKTLNNNLGMSENVSYLQNLLRNSSLKLCVNKNIFSDRHKKFFDRQHSSKRMCS
jgi:hypothetical protein